MRWLSLVLPGARNIHNWPGGSSLGVVVRWLFLVPPGARIISQVVHLWFHMVLPGHPVSAILIQAHLLYVQLWELQEVSSPWFPLELGPSKGWSGSSPLVDSWMSSINYTCLGITMYCLRKCSKSVLLGSSWSQGHPEVYPWLLNG